MDIFKIDEVLTEANKPVTRQEKAWIEIGVRWRIAKDKKQTAKEFADENGILLSTFNRSMIRYRDKIDLSYEAYRLRNTPQYKLTKREREVLIVNNFRQSIKDKISTGGVGAKNKSEKWFKDTLAKGIRSRKVIKPEPGKLYAFVYDAKFKDTLPFWDKFPLIIFLDTVKSPVSGTTLFHGLNLHYIPPKARQQFLEDLLKGFSSNVSLNSRTKLKIDWTKVKGFRGADKMIKAYLPNRVKGHFIEINQEDWANVVTLPLQNFTSGGKKVALDKVWK